MNWGVRIALLYVGFVLMILSLVFMSMSQKVELEEENYYEKEIKYESRIQAMRNAARVQPVQIQLAGNTLVLKYPVEISANVQGTITLFRPSDKRLDRLFKANCDSLGQQNIDIENITGGNYKLKMELTAADKDYYFEESVFIP